MAVIHLGRSQTSFEDIHPEFDTRLLPFVVFLGMRYKNWHQKPLPKKFHTFATEANHFKKQLASQNYFGSWSEELFQVTDHSKKLQFIEQESSFYVQDPKRLITGGGGTLNPETFASILFAGFQILKNKFPNQKHATLESLRGDLSNPHTDMRFSHAARFVNGTLNRYWYKKEIDNLKKLITDPVKLSLFLELLAITAILNKANANGSLAYKAYHQFINNEPFTGFLPVVVSGLNKLRDSGAYSSIHTKTVSYTKALKGNTQGIAVDRWVVAQFGARREYIHDGRKSNASPSLPLQRSIQAYIKILSWYINVPPREIQAMMWYATRTAFGEKSDRGYTATVMNKLGSLFPHESFQ